jgi:type II secretory pathway pseudopilin PulG
MGHGKHNSQQGFTLIASLLIMVLLSGVAAGLLYMVAGSVKMGGNDLEAQLAYYGAESGMEKMTSDLGALYQLSQSPAATAITGVACPSGPPCANYPTNAMVGNISYPIYQINFLNQNPTQLPYPTSPVPYQNNITTGPNSGLYALMTNLQLSITAVRPAGATASMTRYVQVAQVPVFQFGVFCGYDCSYFAGPNFSFGGRVHTNMNLFLAAGSDLVFNDKVQAYKQVITDRLENGFLTNSGDYSGTIYVPSASGGCTLQFPPTGADCLALPGSGTVPGDASWSGGYPTIAGSANANFPGISSGTFNTYLANSTTGVTNMQLPFVQQSCTSNPPPCTDPISIVRKPLAGESPTSTLGSERMYNKAQIHILIADDPADLHPGVVAPQDAQDIRLPYYAANWNTAPFVGATVTLTGGTAGGNAGATEAMGFATIPAAGQQASGWIAPYTDAGQTTWLTWPLMGTIVGNPTCASLTSAVCPTTNAGAPMGPWIRVEYCNTTSCNSPADFVGVTQEWLNLGFGQTFDTPPTCPGFTNAGAACSNLVNRNAILILQQLQPGVVPSAAALASPSDWYPINMYDVREGEMRDNNVGNLSLAPGAGQTGNGNTFTYSTCSVNGIMNVVELDVGNLNQWLLGNTGSGAGKNVNYTNENGYVLYFSDHRGMKKDPNASNGGQTPGGSTIYSGESGLEDDVNSTQNLTSTTQDGTLEAATYYSYSPEDVDQNGVLDNWGEMNLGYGFGRNTNSNPLNSYVRTPATAPVQTQAGAAATYKTYQDCAAAYNDSATGTYAQPAQPYLTNAGDQMGIANMVTGARHVLMLVDGGMSAAGVSPLPTMPTSSGCVLNAANPTGCGGFTVASENPVYVLGNYNSGSADTFFSGGAQMPHSAASIIADTVTVLSNQWSNAMSLLWPTTMGSNMTNGTPIRTANAPAYYRMAVSGGKNIPFPQPTWTNVSKDFGTDGGMHNFLRYLETWSTTLHYNGSLVSMYYSEYNTGVFKCCTVVYSPPTRDFSFDTLFENPTNLPPATPMLQDIVTSSYTQNFTPGQSQ